MIGEVSKPEQAEEFRNPVAATAQATADKGIDVGSNAAGKLRRFREDLYACMRCRADALFELVDAILTAGSFTSPLHLSLVPVHRRSWSSLYAALSRGGIDAEALRDLLASHSSRKEGTRVYAVDVSPWPRCDAEASPGRSYLYHPSHHSAGQPIVAGWAYQVVAGLSFERNPWVVPVDARRVKPHEDANDVAAEQVQDFAGRLPRQSQTPLFVFDAGYDPVRLQLELQGCAAQILVRLNSGRVFYFDPEPPPRRHVGHPERTARSSTSKSREAGPSPLTNTTA